jgi:hypothetical protein
MERRPQVPTTCKSAMPTLMPVVLDPPLTTRQARDHAKATLPGVEVRRLTFWRYLSTQDAAGQLGIEGQIWGLQIVSAAQHDLCPKTLPPPGS